MKELLTLSFVVVFALNTSGQYFREMIKERGIDINQIHPQELLFHGVNECDMELVKLGIKNGAKLNPLPEEDLNKIDNFIAPLCAAISSAADALLPVEEGILASRIRDAGSDYSGRFISDFRRDYIEVIRFLLQNGAKPTIQFDSYSYNEPLRLAVDYRDIEVVRLLLDFKADPNSRQNGSTALEELDNIAYPSSWPYKNTTEIAKLLVSKGAKVTPDLLTSAKESLDAFKLEVLSHWRDMPFYNDFMNSLKSLVDFYSKL